ncbi:MAG TPA: hypothetical protein VE338_15240 [Ktedonobacterales bacterium]|jgi:CII-binding regulator of phage lambda lysogenization HflD|nr:hypothetical protein [Ktedonobacterales bacterium]
MSTDDREERADVAAASADERLTELLAALGQLQRYLDERGSHTYELAQRFIANARRDPASRSYDERQATMLEYQHYIWREIAGRVGQLISLYGEPTSGPDNTPTPDTGAAHADGAQADSNDV